MPPERSPKTASHWVIPPARLSGPAYKIGRKYPQRLLTDVPGTNTISGLFVAATGTGETVLSWSVALVDHPAFWAPPRRVARVHQNYRDAGPHRLVGQELAKLGKGPTGVPVALRPSNLRPLADMGQVLQPDPAAGAFGVRNNLLGNAMVLVLAKAGLLARELLEPAFCAAGAALLQPRTAAVEILTGGLDGGPGVGFPVAVEGDVDDAEVDAEDVLDADRLGVRDVADSRRGTTCP